jgi:mannose-6-phosphate isomerase
MERDYNQIDSFVIFICTEGHFKIQFGLANEIDVNMGETILVPALLKNLTLVPEMKSKILEVYLPENKVYN